MLANPHFRHTIDINADIGELCGQDDNILSFVTTANIACGGHVGDNQSMLDAVRLAKQRGVNIGAHPSYPDRLHFGRQSMIMTPEQLTHSLIDQISALAHICQLLNVEMFHVKPHGALYNDAANDPALAQVIVDAVIAINPNLALMGLANSALIKVARANKLNTIEEAFADRSYLSNGRLAPRTMQGAVISNHQQAVKQVLDMITLGQVTSLSGEVVNIAPQSICLHGDNQHAVEFAQHITLALSAQGIGIRAINKNT